MSDALSRNIQRGYRELSATTDARAEHAEQVRDELLTAVETYIERLRVEDAAAGAEAAQYAKRFRLYNQASWWLVRRICSPRALLRDVGFNP